MTRGVRLYLVGSFVLVSLAGCGRGFFSAEREPWRAEAEIACLKSGAIKESPEVVRIDPISGPGMCGAEFPLKVAALGEGVASFGFADDLRPPGTIGNQPRWPISPAPATSAPQGNYPQGNYQGGYSGPALRQPNYAPPSNGPISLTAPGVATQEDEIDLPAEAAPGQPPYQRAPAYPSRDRYATPPQAPYAAPTRHRGSDPRRAIPSTRSVRSRSSRPRRWPVRSSRRSTAGSPIPCSRRRNAGSGRAWSRSSRSPPIPAAA